MEKGRWEGGKRDKWAGMPGTREKDSLQETEIVFLILTKTMGFPLPCSIAPIVTYWTDLGKPRYGVFSPESLWNWDNFSQLCAEIHLLRQRHVLVRNLHHTMLQKLLEWILIFLSKYKKYKLSRLPNQKEGGRISYWFHWFEICWKCWKFKFKFKT